MVNMQMASLKLERHGLYHRNGALRRSEPRRGWGTGWRGVAVPRDLHALGGAPGSFLFGLCRFYSFLQSDGPGI